MRHLKTCQISLPEVGLVVAVSFGEVVAGVVATGSKALMEPGSILRSPRVPFSEAFFRTRIASSI